MARPFAVGLTAGGAGSLVGLGGGFVAIPLLTGWLKLPQHVAHGTSLAAVTATGSCGAAGYWGAGAVDAESALAVAAGGVAMSPIGAVAAKAIPARRLRQCLGVLLLGVAPAVALRPQLHAAQLRWRGSRGEEAGRRGPLEHWGPLVATGLVSGLLAGMFGIGGGTVTVPAVTLATGCDHHTALGTSLLAMVPAGAVGAATHLRQGTCSIALAAPLAAGSCCGAYAGACLGSQAPEDAMRFLFAGLTAVLGVRAIASA
eukprot:TRINITY_DN56419_c0_g1_i1.p1 TRINITY_DN56419_c0_g1~~TRINITY_DN56419_c0_g1_i1.p1  ORF type:complete len:283 (+),score=70.27 TRINITY_DN56419_c0_g1_i1:77-850(+)